MSDPFAPLATATAANTDNAPKRKPVLPVPPDAPPVPHDHMSLGVPSHWWTYRDPAGDLLGYVARFDGPEGKQFRPLVLFKDEPRDSYAWRWESWPAPRPLYGLDRLTARPNAPVVICEGEKAADAATDLLPDYVAVTSPNGSKSASKADWSPLAGRYVTIWPDADTAGAEYASAVCKTLAITGALAVEVASPPAGVAVGWDAADAQADGWTEAQARDFVAGATAPPAQSKGDGGKPDRRPPQRDSLIGLTESFELWHDTDGRSYVTLPVKGHIESWAVRSPRIKAILSGEFYKSTGQTVGGQALEDALRVLEARAITEGPESVACRRVGCDGERCYLDLCDADWRTIEVTCDGWNVVDRVPVKLLRTQAMRALPEPERGAEITTLRRFANMSDDDFLLVVAWLVAAMWWKGPYPILVIAGEQGSGKSMFTRMVRALVDPSAAPIRTPPRDDRDLLVQAYNAHVIALDNLSSIPTFLSDGLCRLATGGGFSTRKLHTDDEETVFDAARPIILNGIPLLTERPDLAERSLTIHLRTIPETERMPEDVMLRAFEDARPHIIGALLDGVASAIRRLPETRLEKSPRMADFARLAVAAMPGLGYTGEDFMNAYDGNRRDATDATFEADAVAVAVRNLIVEEYPTGWTATAMEWLGALSERVSESVRKSKAWPFTAQSFGNRIERIAPLLRQKGFAVEKRHSGVRTITIAPLSIAPTERPSLSMESEVPV